MSTGTVSAAGLQPGNPSHAPSALKAWAQKSCESFAASGLPTKQAEAFRYAALESLRERSYKNASETTASLDATWLDKRIGESTSAERTVVKNGKLDTGFSIQQVRGLEEEAAHVGTLAPQSELVALNSSFANGHALTLLGAREVVSVTLGDELANHPRLFVRVPPKTEAKLMLRFVGAGKAQLVNAVTEIVIEEGASLVLEVAASLDNDAAFTQALGISVGQGAKLNFGTAQTNAALQHALVHVSLAADADANLSVLQLCGHKSNANAAIVVEHQGPRARSLQTLRALAADEASCTFDSLVRVVHGAKGTASQQDSRALLLSKQASAQHKPQLQIHDDDVKCAHGSTTGQLNEAQLFYLRSRGVPEVQARSLLASAFVAPALALLSESTRASVQHQLDTLSFIRTGAL